MRAVELRKKKKLIITDGPRIPATKKTGYQLERQGSNLHQVRNNQMNEVLNVHSQLTQILRTYETLP